MFKCKCVLHAYKFSLSGALTCLLERRSGSTGEGSEVGPEDTGSADSAEAQAAL